MKKLFEKLSSFVKSILGNIFDEFKKHSEAAVKVTGNIKKLVESPIADVVVTVIPGDIDNAIVEKLRKVLPEVTQKVAILHGILKENDTNSDIIGSVIENLKQMNLRSKKQMELKNNNNNNNMKNPNLNKIELKICLKHFINNFNSNNPIYYKDLLLHISNFILVIQIRCLANHSTCLIHIIQLLY